LQNKNFAAVDIGTNSFHLIIVNTTGNNSFRIIDREKVVIRLGSRMGNEMNFITPSEIEEGIKILKKFKKLADSYNAEMHAVATSAVREAENKIEFLESVFNETGIEIEVISGYKEAEYIYKGIRKAIDIKDKKLLCMDIGGGSTEFILGRNDDIFFADSIKIGAVRLSKKFFPDFIISDEAIGKCKVYIDEQIRKSEKINFNEQYDYAIGASGTILAIAGMLIYRMNGKKIKPLNNFIIKKDELDKLTLEILSKKTPEERINIEGMEYKRADIIPAGLLILQKAFEIFRINEMIVSEYALREGVVLSMMEKVSA